MQTHLNIIGLTEPPEEFLQGEIESGAYYSAMQRSRLEGFTLGYLAIVIKS